MAQIHVKKKFLLTIAALVIGNQLCIAQSCSQLINAVNGNKLARYWV
jgi:hypothetical protein